MRHLLPIFASCMVTIVAQCTYAQNVLEELQPGQLAFLKQLDGEWTPKKVLVGGKEFNDKVALIAVNVSRDGFEFVDPNKQRRKYQFTRVSEQERRLALMAQVDGKPVRYLMRLDGETMWLCTKANDKYETELKDEPTQYNLCILLERKPKR